MNSPTRTGARPGDAGAAGTSRAGARGRLAGGSGPGGGGTEGGHGKSGLPDGFRVRLGSRTRVYDGGRTVIGGAPAKAARLSDAARAMLDGRELCVRDAGTRVLADRLLELGMADPVVAALPWIGLDSVTVVIPIRDRVQALDALLHSLPDGVPVVVVDDCSDDPAALAEVAGEHGAAVVRHPVNRGPAAARNTGLAHVATPYVAFVDSDVVVEPDTLATLLRHFADPAVALVAPRILGRYPDARQSWVSRYENERASLDLGREPALVRPRTPVAWVPSACVVARVEALGDGFDATMRVGEDVDLVWRLARTGWRVRYEPGAIVHHDHRSRFGAWFTRKLFYGTGAAPLAKRHGRTVAPAVFSPWAAVFAAGLLTQRRWSLTAAGLALAAGRRRIAARVGPAQSGRPAPGSAGVGSGRVGFAGSGFARSGQAAPGSATTGSGRGGRASPDGPGVAASARLTAEAAAGALVQTSALLLRHWWPAAAVGSVFSRRIRRAVVTAAVADSVVEYTRTDAELDPLRFAAARRLDDIAYGTGVWLGALRARSARCLVPDIQRQQRTR